MMLGFGFFFLVYNVSNTHAFKCLFHTANDPNEDGSHSVSV